MAAAVQCPVSVPRPVDRLIELNGAVSRLVIAERRRPGAVIDTAVIMDAAARATHLSPTCAAILHPTTSPHPVRRRSNLPSSGVNGCHTLGGDERTSVPKDTESRGDEEWGGIPLSREGVSPSGLSLIHI